MSKLRVVLADDHAVVRAGLRALIEAQPDMEVVGEAGDGRTAARQVYELTPDVAVLDVSMPGGGGAGAAEEIRRERPGVRVVVLTVHEDRGYLQLLLKAGASGYVLKRSAPDDLIRAVRTVVAGGTYLDPAVAGHLLPGATSGGAGGVSGEADLSEREADVLRLLAQGYLVKQIATRLEVGGRTIETYKVRAMERLGLKSRADVVRYALFRGWLGAD